MIVDAPPESLPDPTSTMTIMDGARWRADPRLRKGLWKALCARGDPPPRELRPGSGNKRMVSANVSALVRERPGARPARGWKVLLLELAGLKQTMWQAIAHVVVENADGTLTDATDEPLGQYVLLRSSRIAPDMDDSALLNGRWTFPSVVGGNEAFKSHMLVNYPDLASSPEDVVPQKVQQVYIPKGVQSWASRRHPDRDVVALVTSMRIARSAGWDEPLVDTMNTMLAADMQQIERTSATQEEAQSRIDALLDAVPL